MNQQNWMSQFFKNNPKLVVRLKDLVIAGTHHSTVSSVQRLAKLFSPWAVCQSHSIQKQFKLGVRFFHLAVSEYNETIQTSHYFYSQQFQYQVNALKKCLQDHPRQIIILYLKKDRSGNLEDSGRQKLMKFILKTFEQIGLIKSQFQQSDLNVWYQSNKFAGRVVLSGFKRFPQSFIQQYVWDCPNSYHFTKANNAADLRDNLIVYADKMKHFKTTKYLHNIECIVTLNIKSVLMGSTILKQTNRFKPMFRELLERDSMVQSANIIMFDFVEEQDTQAIISMNYKRFVNKK